MIRHSEDDHESQEHLDLRAELSRVHRERLTHLENRIDRVDEKVKEELNQLEDRLNNKFSENSRRLSDLSMNVQSILDNQSRREPALEALESVIRSGIVMKWILVAIVTTLGAIAAIPAAIVALKGLFK